MHLATQTNTALLAIDTTTTDQIDSRSTKGTTILHIYHDIAATPDMSEVVKLPVFNRMVLGSNPGSVKQ